MPRSRYGIFREGISISGINLNLHQKGKVFYVCNSTVPPTNGAVGSDNAKGTSTDHPLATLAKAVSLTTANRGDKIVILPGHAETVSAAGGLALSTAGVDIIGTGTGSLRPTITLGTANTATVTITAANVTITNVVFVANFLNIATCIDVTTATDTIIDSCEFRDTSAILNFVKAIRTDTTDNHADGLVVTNSVMLGTGTSATTSFVNSRGAISRLVVNDNTVNIQGTTATTGALILATSKAMTGTQVLRNNVSSPLTTSSAGGLIVAGTGGSGTIRENYLYVPAAASAILITTGAGLGEMNNYVTRSAVDTSGLLLPAASS